MRIHEMIRNYGSFWLISCMIAVYGIGLYSGAIYTGMVGETAARLAGQYIIYTGLGFVIAGVIYFKYLSGRRIPDD